MLPLPTERTAYVAKDGTPTRDLYNWLKDLERTIKAVFDGKSISLSADGTEILIQAGDGQAYTSVTIGDLFAAGGVYMLDLYGPGGAPHLGYLRIRIDDATGGSEDATWHFGSITAGVHRDTLTFSQTFASFGIAAFPNFVDDTAAAAGGVAIGQFYRNGSVVMVRVT